MPQATTDDVMVTARGLVKRFGDFTAVDGIDVDVHRGEAFLTTAVERSLIRDWMSDDRAGPDEPLTPREQEVLGLMAEGLSAPAIGQQLYLATATVKSHQARIYEKLGVSDRAAAVAAAMRAGLLE